MSKKEDIKKLISNLKKASKNKVIPSETISDALTRAFVHPAFRVKDMKEEARNMGAHGADVWGGT